MTFNSLILLDCILFVSFGILLYLYFLPLLKRLNFGQNVRALGPKEHFKKSGTPTMGGIIILICVLIFYSLLLIEFKYFYHVELLKCLFLIIPIILYGIIGFVDDYLIIFKHNNDGIKPTLKFIIQLVISVIVYFCYLTIFKSNEINFFGIMVDIKFLYGLFIIFLLVGVTNATNLTDGIDGLLSICSIISYLGFGILGIYKGELSVVVFSFSVVLALCSFLLFNLPTAKLFMGNIGSLLLGSGLVMMSIILHVEILLIFIGFVYFMEVVSVILQVWFFKKKNGERLFKMTPIHHHLELSGFSEIEIDIAFGVLQLIMTVIGVWLGIMFF